MPTLIEIFCPGEAVPAADIQAFLHLVQPGDDGFQFFD